MSTRILVGDCRVTLPTLPERSVRCCVTSPPYWGLRDYGHGDQIGLESTPDAYVEQLVAVFREVRRVLTDDGTLWLNLGSSYFGSTQTGGNNGFNASGGVGGFKQARQFRRPSSGDKRPIQSRADAPAYGTDGRALQDSTGAGSAYSGLCDGCLADFLTHRDCIAGNVQPTEQSAPLPSQTDRDSEPSDSAPASLDVSPLDVQASTTIESWRQHRGACSRCDNRASALSVLPRSSGDDPALGCMSWLKYSTMLKQKDMVPIPWMVAMALQADGWYLRSDIIWHKPNPMPESVTDRPTKAHEYVFLLSKSARYYYDHIAIMEPAQYGEQHASKTTSWGTNRKHPNKANAADYAFAGNNNTTSRMEDGSYGRNKRTVWTVATSPYKGAHFATFPPALIEPCILAGSAKGDTILDPFGGAGTTALVADRLGRDAILCELNPTYAGLAEQRVTNDSPLFSEVIR